MTGLIISVPESSRCVTQTVFLQPSLVAKTQRGSPSRDGARSCTCWGEPPLWIPERVMQRGDIVWVERSRWHASYFLALNRIRETAAEVECFFAFRFCVQSTLCDFNTVYSLVPQIGVFLCTCRAITVLYTQTLSVSQCPALPQPHRDALGSGNMGRGTQGGRTPRLERNSNEAAQSRSLFPRQQAPNK